MNGVGDVDPAGPIDVQQRDVARRLERAITARQAALTATEEVSQDQDGIGDVELAVAVASKGSTPGVPWITSLARQRAASSRPSAGP